MNPISNIIMEENTTEVDSCFSFGQQLGEATPTGDSRRSSELYGDNGGSDDQDGSSNNADTDSEDEVSWCLTVCLNMEHDVIHYLYYFIYIYYTIFIQWWHS